MSSARVHQLTTRMRTRRAFATFVAAALRTVVFPPCPLRTMTFLKPFAARLSRTASANGA
jgi:hypothetical protein